MSLVDSNSWSKIPIANASAYTLSWQRNTPIMKAFLFHRSELDCVLNETEKEESTVAVRFYMGINNEGLPEMIVVGVDDNGEDIYNAKETDSRIYNFALPCPSVCDDGSGELMHTDTIVINDTRLNTITDCVETLYEIPFSTAFDWTEAWQDDYALKSVLFSEEDILAIFDEYEVDTIRVYFGLEAETGIHRTILIGVDDYANDIDTAEVYANSAPACTSYDKTTCDDSSDLYHDTATS